MRFQLLDTPTCCLRRNASSYAGATVGSPGGAGWSAQGTPRGAASVAASRRPRQARWSLPQRPPCLPAVSPQLRPSWVNHWDERWTAHLAPLVSSQERRRRINQRLRAMALTGRRRTTRNRRPAPKPTFASEGEMEGGPESPAQGHVAAGNRTGSWASTGPPSGVIWRPEVLQVMEAADGAQSVDIGYHGSRNGVTFSLNTVPGHFP